MVRQDASFGQDCNNNGIPDANEIQAVHASLDFDGVDDSVRIPRSVSMEPTHEMTFELWVRPDTTGPSHSMLCRFAGGGGAGYILAWQWSNGGRLQLRIDQATNGSLIIQDTTPTSSYNGQWQHVAFTYSVSANAVVLYVNGIAKASAAAVGPLRYSNSDLTIGNSPFGSTDDFDGRIDEVKIWNVAKTQAQIAAEMARYFPLPTPGIAGFWRFDAGAGQTVADSSLNLNHGLRGSDNSAESMDPTWASSGAPINTGDCNNNGVLDSCDISAATSQDCNANGRPDECESGSASDCNNNGIPDLCDIHAGTSPDCNANAVPDSCDMVAGIPDMDANGILDTCVFPLVYERTKPCGRLYLGTTGALDGIRVHQRSGAAVNTLQSPLVDYKGGTITFDGARNLLVSEWNQDRIRVIGRDGSLVRLITGGGLDGPHGATVTPAGTIAVCSYLSDSIKFYTMSGTYISNLGHGNGTEDPHCLAYDRDGNLYVGCRNNGAGHVGKFNSQQQFVSYIGQGTFAPHPLDMAFDAGQNLYVTTPGMIRKFNPAGTLVQTITQAGLDPRGIAIDETGRLWITNLSARNIFRFTSAGVYIDTININLGAGAPAALALWGIALDVKPDGDCNNNGTTDGCDIEAGTVDCDSDGVPDSCQMATGDCNANNVLDRCESGDCDGDGIRDLCEVLAGASDCDSNNVPDDCDVLASYSRVFTAGTAHAWPSEHPNNPPANCRDGNTSSYTWSTASFNTQNPSYLSVDFPAATAIDGIRLWKDNDGGGGATTKNLAIQYTTDALPNPGGGAWQNVSGLSNGYLGTELLQATAVNANGTVTGDVHDSVNEGHGWATLRFNRVTATAIRIGFSVPDTSNNHYKVHELQLFRIDASVDCNNNGSHDACDIAAGTLQDCNENGIADVCELVGPSQIPGVVVSPVNGRPYKLTAPKSWLAAEAEAVSLGTHLATVRSAAENQWILEFVTANSADTRAWIGFTDQAVEGTFVWTSGISPSYTNWYSGEPNNSGNEDATEMLCTVFTPGTWNDTPGNESHVGVVEFGPITDCNENGVLDECDISSGTISDCDANGVPDDCQSSDDCNINGIRDFCDIASGTSPDCNQNSVPDSCDFAGAPDCNANNVPDVCDIASANYAIRCDGANDLVALPTSLVSTRTTLTFEAWFKTTAKGVIFGYQNSVYPTNPSAWMPVVYVGLDGKLRGKWYDDQLPIPVSAGVVNDGAWHHVALVGAVNVQRLYLDGVEVPGSPISFPIVHSNMIHSQIGFGFAGGVWPSSNSPFPFAGEIDEVRIWSVARTQAQIVADMNTSIIGARPGLIGNWNLNEGAGQIAADASGAGNNGRLGTATTADASDPTWVHVFGDVPGGTDCNGNNIPDSCDIAAATVTDCNSNNVPDSCESDCNNNGVADACDIAGGTVPDCNGNGIPDACDIAAATSTDVNSNGIPDSCEPDIRLIPVISIINPTSTTEVRSAQPSSINAVSRGTRYFIEVWASDVGGTNTGLTGAYTDVNFCGQTTATAVFHGNIFNVFPAGTIQTTKVDEFGGSALPNGGGIAPQWVRVGWIEMNAGTESAGCNVSLTPGAGGVAAFNRGLINPALIVFGSVSLVITPPAKTYDLDNNTNINVGDLSLFAGSWLTTVPPGNTAHDFDCDDQVGVSDLSWFATGWNKSVTDPTILYPPCDGGGGGWGPDEDPGQQPTDVAFKIAVLSTPSSSDNRLTVPNSIANINEGQQYYVEVWASDIGDINTGITSAYLDLMLPPTAAAVISINHNGIFTVFPSGAEDEGVVDELGGSNLSADVGAEPIWSRLATVRLFADANRPVKVFSLTPSATGVAAYGRGGVSWNAIELDTVSIGTPGPGDLDADGDVDQADMAMFINVLLGSDTNPGHIARSDMNVDTLANGQDVSGFVAELTGP